MVPLYSPQTESEAAVISSLLEAHKIPFFIRGGGFGKLVPGPQIDSLNTQTFMVSEADLAVARELLADFLLPSEPSRPTKKPSSKDKLRVILEAVLFGWFVPGRRDKS